MTGQAAGPESRRRRALSEAMSRRNPVSSLAAVGPVSFCLDSPGAGNRAAVDARFHPWRSHREQQQDEGKGRFRNHYAAESSNYR